MKAIVSIINEPAGQRVYLLGMGETERDARIAAFATLNHGHNIIDDEYSGGVLCDVSPGLEALYNGVDESVTTVRDGDSITVEASDSEVAFERALGRLYLDENTLRFRD